MSDATRKEAERLWDELRHGYMSEPDDVIYLGPIKREAIDLLTAALSRVRREAMRDAVKVLRDGRIADTIDSLAAKIDALAEADDAPKENA